MISNTKSTSIESYAITKTTNLDKDLLLIETAAEKVPTFTVDELRQDILDANPSLKGKDEIGARVKDAQRIHGSVQKTGIKRESKCSGRKAFEWSFVLPIGRTDARRAYWEERAAGLEADYQQARRKLYRDAAKAGFPIVTLET